LSFGWQPPGSTLSIGHFYFAQLGHSLIAVTWIILKDDKRRCNLLT
jgi:hypothetical protein